MPVAKSRPLARATAPVTQTGVVCRRKTSTTGDIRGLERGDRSGQALDGADWLTSGSDFLPLAIFVATSDAEVV